MKVLLLHLPLARRSWLAQFALPEPLAQLYLGAALKQRHELRFVDLRVTPDLERELAGFEPDAAIVGINPVYDAACDPVLARLRARFPRIRILLSPDAEYGNTHVTDRPLDFAHPLADALVEPYSLARGREIVPAVIDAWETGRPLAEVAGLWIPTETGRWTRTAPVENRVGPIGAADRTLLGRARGRYRFAGISETAFVFYTYGCHYKCRFCPMSKHDGSIVRRPLDEMIPELAALTEPNVYLQDYEPFLAPAAMEELADAVEREGIEKSWYMLTRADTSLAQEALIRRWQKLGLRWLYLGLDGSSPERLKEIKKGATVETNERALRRMLELGLSVSVGFVVRSDFTREDFAALRAYVKHLRAPLVGFTVETPLVGTKLFDDNVDALTTRDWSLYDLGHAVLPTAMPLREFYGELARLHMLGGVRTLMPMLRHYPLRDTLRIWTTGWRGLLGVRNAHRDHQRPPGAPRRDTRAPAASSRLDGASVPHGAVP
jgi:hypothetical protein